MHPLIIPALCNYPVTTIRVTSVINLSGNLRKVLKRRRWHGERRATTICAETQSDVKNRTAYLHTNRAWRKKPTKYSFQPSPAAAGVHQEKQKKTKVLKMLSTQCCRRKGGQSEASVHEAAPLWAAFQDLNPVLAQ